MPNNLFKNKIIILSCKTAASYNYIYYSFIFYIEGYIKIILIIILNINYKLY